MDGIAAKTMNRVAERLEPRLLAARGELYAAIRDAHAERATFATIASVAGLSREWVRRIVKERSGHPQGYQSRRRGAFRPQGCAVLAAAVPLSRV